MIQWWQHPAKIGQMKFIVIAWSYCEAPSCTIVKSHRDVTNSCTNTHGITNVKCKSESQLWNITRTLQHVAKQIRPAVDYTSHFILIQFFHHLNSFTDFHFVTTGACVMLLHICAALHSTIFQLYITTFPLIQIMWFGLHSEHQNYPSVEGKQAFEIFSKPYSCFSQFKDRIGLGICKCCFILKTCLYIDNRALSPCLLLLILL